jgi:hypothetical protein
MAPHSLYSVLLWPGTWSNLGERVPFWAHLKSSKGTMSLPLCVLELLKLHNARGSPKDYVWAPRRLGRLQTMKSTEGSIHSITMCILHPATLPTTADRWTSDRYTDNNWKCTIFKGRPLRVKTRVTWETCPSVFIWSELHGTTSRMIPANQSISTPMDSNLRGIPEQLHQNEP